MKVRRQARLIKVCLPRNVSSGRVANTMSFSSNHCMIRTPWADIPYEPWRETCTALHLYTQIVGKYRLARTPWINHSWQATFYVNAWGFTSSLVPDRPGGVEISFDLLDHTVRGAATDGRSAQFSLGPMSVAEFYRRFVDMVGTLGGTPKFHWRPNEVPNPVRFTEDRAQRP